MWAALGTQIFNFWIPSILVGLVVLFLLVMALLFVGIILASCFETQRVRDFVPAASHQLPRPLLYAVVMNQAATLSGFQPGGVFAKDRKGRPYQVGLHLWLSPDNISLLCVFSGKLVFLPYKRTVVMSRFAADRILVTTDALTPEDLSGTMDIEIVLNADFRELMARHSFRLAASGVSPQPFLPGNLLAEFEQIYRIRAEHLVALGLARFLDPSRNEWRFTLKGAWLNAYLTHTKGLQKAQAQRERMKMTRPGG
jgi:hypothetical protein